MQARELGDLQATAIDSFLELTVRLPQLGDPSWMLGGESAGSPIQNVVGLVNQVMAGSGFQDLTEIAPNLPCFRASWGAFFDGVQELTGLKPGKILEQARAMLGRANRGGSLLPSSDVPRARELFRQAAEANPDSIFLYFQAGCGMLLLGEEAEWPERLREVEELYRRASTGDSLIPGIERAGSPETVR